MNTTYNYDEVCNTLKQYSKVYARIKSIVADYETIKEKRARKDEYWLTHGCDDVYFVMMDEIDAMQYNFERRMMNFLMRNVTPENKEDMKRYFQRKRRSGFLMQEFNEDIKPYGYRLF